MKEENVPVITDRDELYDKCENMEQLFSSYYLPLLEVHYRKTYDLKQENKSLQSQLKAKEEAEKEFIKYLEEKIEHNTPRARWKHYNEDGFNDYDLENGDYIEAQPVNITLKEVILKFNEILSKGENK